MKPLWRITIGNVTDDSLCLFKISIRKLCRLFANQFDIIICCNETDEQKLQKIKKISTNLNVDLILSNWNNFPLDGVENNPKKRLGSFWKLCPPRLRIKSHEIVMDNDILINQPLPQIEQFLLSNQPLLLEENVRNFGKYYFCFSEGEKYNSGLYGLPPNFDFTKELRESWEKLGSFKPLVSEDEQGLITYILKKNNPIKIPKHLVVQLLPQGLPTGDIMSIENKFGINYGVTKKIFYEEYNFNKKEYAFHFCGINRESYHKYWHKYLNTKFN